MANKMNSKMLVAAAGAVLSLAGASQAFTLVDFKPDPNTVGFPEVVYSGTPRELTAGTGAQGDSSITTPGGLRIETPLHPTLPAAYSAGFDHTGGGTTFLDVTLNLSDLKEAGTAIATELVPPVGPNPGVYMYTQALTNGAFELLSFDPDNIGPLASLPLLKGNIIGATISAVQAPGNLSGIGWVFSAKIQYTEGAIYDALVAATGNPNQIGDLSWSLNDVTSVGTDTAGKLKDFQANMTGQFGSPAIPEPATLGALALGSIGLLARRRSR